MLLQQLCYYGYYENLDKGVTCNWILKKISKLFQALKNCFIHKYLDMVMLVPTGMYVYQALLM